MPHDFFAGEPIILAHRGASAYAPEHTLTAIRLALEQGADVIEADVHVSRDGHPILHHSGSLSENTEGNGPVHRFTLQQLEAFDAGHRFSPDGGRSFPYRGKGERVLSLAEALSTFPDARFNLEIKDRRAARPTRRLIDERGATHRVLLASWYSWRGARALRGYTGPRSVTADAMLAFMLLHWTRLDGLWSPAIDAFQVPELFHGIRLLTPRLVRRAHHHRIRVHVWTVNEEADIDRLLDWEVDGIVTDVPDIAKRARTRYLRRTFPGPSVKHL